jgi:hypothetical protein
LLTLLRLHIDAQGTTKMCVLLVCQIANNWGCCGIVMGAARHGKIMCVMMGDGRRTEEREREMSVSDQRFYLMTNWYFLFDKPLRIFHY